MFFFNLFTVISSSNVCGRLHTGRIGTGFICENAKASWQLWGAKEACLSLQALFCKENTGTCRMTMFQCIFILNLSVFHLSPHSKETWKQDRERAVRIPPFQEADCCLRFFKSINGFLLLHFLLLIWTLKHCVKETVLKAPYKLWVLSSFICQTSERRCSEIAGWGFFFPFHKC